ncbi:quinic acid utilization activator [Fusarium sporotrichioides]|uniref:Quinic acid utilization activator n=1 Tax=Fusarium sporotrichioides TaxID=5514 RepID=A0A395SQH3_FUSSP|nr:quinic acid utilization activator [Fusarium sporotrichioides]
MSTTKTQMNHKLPAKDPHRGPKRARTDADESDEGSYGRNRHRVTRACNECRRRKDRCGGQKPSCVSCTENDRVCSYGPSKKRGLRPGYVRAIEALLGLMLTTIEGSEAWICGLLQGKPDQISLRLASVEVQESDMSVDFLLDIWRKCNLCKEAGKLLAPENLETDEDGTDSTRYFDTKLVEAFALSQSSRDDGENALLTPMNTDTTPHEVALFDSPPTPVVSVHTSNQSMEAVSQAPTISHHEAPASNSIEVSPSSILQVPMNWPYLMDVYFETTHSWLPISQKHELLRTAYTVANKLSTSANAPSSGELAFLHAVLMYSSHQASTIPNLSKASVDNTYRARSPQDLTQSSLFSDPVAYDLGHVKAFLVLSLLEMDCNCWNNAWTAIGRAVYTATSLGLISRDSTKEPSVYDDNAKRTVLGSRLNDLIHEQKRPASDQALHETMLACQQNLLEDPPITPDIPPQKLCLWVASVTTLEVAAAERLASHGKSSWRPDGYWKRIASLVYLIEIRAESMGRCSVSPAVQNCLELLQKTIARHQLQYTGTDDQHNFHLVQRNIAAAKGSLQTIFNKEPHIDVVSTDQATTNVPKPIHPVFTNDSVPPRENTITEVPATTFTISTQSEMIYSSTAQRGISTTILPQSVGVENNGTFETSRSSLGEDLEDEGLFDSLATLDSTDWLANPPEFMQHLGLLDNPSTSMENIFDMEF